MKKVIVKSCLIWLDVISTLVLTEVSLSFSSLFTLSLDAMTCIKPVIVP